MKGDELRNCYGKAMKLSGNIRQVLFKFLTQIHIYILLWGTNIFHFGILVMTEFTLTLCANYNRSSIFF